MIITFLPYADFPQTARSLDYCRLGAQRLAAKQILITLFHGGPDIRRPAVKMWKGYERALAHYGVIICDEWKSRHGCDYIGKVFRDVLGAGIDLDYERPWWLGDETFHKSHRSFLLRKYPTYYRKLWPELTAHLPLQWPDPVRPQKSAKVAYRRAVRRI